MDEKRFTLDEVEAAFERLYEFVLRQAVDATCTWAVESAKSDVLAILAGEWHDDEPAPQQEEGPDDAPRCSACGQTMRDIGKSLFACPTCYATFGDDVIEKAILPF